MGYRLEEMTVNELENVLQTVKTVILPIGIIEQHGFHLPLNTDSILATAISQMALQNINAVIAPAIPYCYSGGGLKGTINVSPNIFSMLTADICSEFARTGFKNIIILLGHGGEENTRVLKDALYVLLQKDDRFKDMTVSMVGVWELSKTWMEIFNMQPEHDWHAGLAETSAMMYLRPDLVREEIVLDRREVVEWMRLGVMDKILIREKTVDHPYVIPKISYSREICIGVFGFPENATRELGEKICFEAANGLIEYVNFLDSANHFAE